MINFFQSIFRVITSAHDACLRFKIGCWSISNSERFTGDWVENRGTISHFWPPCKN